MSDGENLAGVGKPARYFRLRARPKLSQPPWRDIFKTSARNPMKRAAASPEIHPPWRRQEGEGLQDEGQFIKGPGRKRNALCSAPWDRLNLSRGDTMTRNMNFNLTDPPADKLGRTIPRLAALTIAAILVGTVLGLTIGH